MSLSPPSTNASFSLDPRLAAVTLPVLELELCSLRLMNDSRWPWLILVPRVAAMREMIDLDAVNHALLWREIERCSRALRAACNPHKLNVAALGNVVAQLHVHIIGRFESDSAWPAPVWGRGEAEPYAQPELDAFKSALRAKLDLG